MQAELVVGLFGAPPARAFWSLDWLAPLGGLIFGIGAGPNGASSFSTFSRLAEGHLVMLFTLAGWGLGLAAVAGTLPGLYLPAHPGICPGSPSFLSPSGWDGRRAG